MKKFLLGLCLFLVMAPDISSADNLYIKDSSGAYISSVLPYQELASQAEPSNIFQDTFDSGVRDVNNWNTPTTAGGAVACTWSSGTVTCGTGTTANGYAYMTTVPTFRPTQPGYTRSGYAINIPKVIPANTYAAWGMFTPTATPTVGSPIQEGCAFEILVSGKEDIACYAGAAKTVIQDMSSGTGNGMQPTDGITHGFVMDFRGDAMVWYLASYTPGSKDPIGLTVIATQQNGINGPNVNTQPMTLMTVAGSIAPGSSLTLSIAATWVAATNNNNWLADANYPFRKATVDTGGNLHVVAAPYSPTQTFVSASSGNIANASAVATVSAVAAKTNFLTGFDITSDGATVGLCVSPTITGILGGTRTYTYCAPAGGALIQATPLIRNFIPPLQASAVNTAIVITLPALGAGSTNAAVNAESFNQ